MKIQDLTFLVIFLFLLFRRDEKWLAIAGLGSLILAIPFFAKWIFFTAAHLVWYAAAFFLLSIILNFLKLRHSK